MVKGKNQKGETVSIWVLQIDLSPLIVSKKQRWILRTGGIYPSFITVSYLYWLVLYSRWKVPQWLVLYSGWKVPLSDHWVDHHMILNVHGCCLVNSININSLICGFYRVLSNRNISLLYKRVLNLFRICLNSAANYLLL